MSIHEGDGSVGTNTGKNLRNKDKKSQLKLWVQWKRDQHDTYKDLYDPICRYPRMSDRKHVCFCAFNCKLKKEKEYL